MLEDVLLEEILVQPNLGDQPAWEVSQEVAFLASFTSSSKKWFSRKSKRMRVYRGRT